MTLVQQLLDGFAEVSTKIKSVRAMIGAGTTPLTSLTTADKSSVVAAINEVVANGGGGGGGPVTAADITDSTSTGRALITAADAPAARTTIGATTAGNALITAADAAAVRAAAGLSTLGSTIGTAANAGAVRTAISVYSAAEVDSVAALAASNAVDAKVDGAPGALDTLNELAAALGDDPDFAGTVTNSLAQKVATTAAQGLNGTQQANARANIAVYGTADIGDPATDFVAAFNTAYNA